MKCIACGEENADRAKFCAFCGKSLPTPSPEPEPEEELTSRHASRSDRVYARPLPENPVQPRRMPHIHPKDAAEEENPPEKRDAPPREEPAPTSERRGPRPVIRPNPKQMFLFEDELETPDEPDTAPPRDSDAPRKTPPRKATPRRDREEYEEDEDIERKSRVVIRFFTVLTVLVLIASTMIFVTYSGAGRRLRTQLGWNVTSADYLFLADWQAQHGNNEDAAASYYDAFLLDQTDYELCLQVAAGFASVEAYTRTEQVYVYMMEKWPEAEEPYNSLLALLAKQGKTAEYEALVKYRSGETPSQTPVPAAPTASWPSGEYLGSIQLTLTAEEGAEIRYTLDGSAPSLSSLLYTGPLTITGGKHTIRAACVLNGVLGAEWSGVYAINAKS